MRVETLVIAARFNGPDGSANGGYFAGQLAQLLNGAGSGPEAVTVTLRRPPPLETALDVVRDDAGLQVMAGDVLVGEAAPGALDGDPVEPVSFAAASAAARDYGGLVEHPFPRCFSCGPARDDGLGLKPGRLADRSGYTAAAWTPDASLLVDSKVPDPIVWSALDCPGGWTVDLVGRPMVLGRMTGQVVAQPALGEPCVIMGRLDRRDGRKAFTSTTAYGADGRHLGRAQATWIEVHA